MIYLAFYKGTKAQNPQHARIADRLICWWTKSRFSHVELVEKLGVSAGEVRVGRCWAASNRDGRVRVANIELHGDRWVLVPVNAEPEKVMSWFFRHYGQRYDWLGAFSHVLPWLGQNPVKWYCSEAIAAALEHDATHVTPEELFQRIVGMPSLQVAV